MKAPDETPAAMGKIITNLLSLELLLRLFLHDTLGPRDPNLSLQTISVGTVIPVTPLTSYDSLRQLVTKVNRVLKFRGAVDFVDESLVELRDAIAHGRIMASRPEGPFRLFKFDKPGKGVVRVSVIIDLTPDWLKAQTRRTFAEIQKLFAAGHSLSLPSFACNELK